MTRKIAIVGSAETSRDLAPFDDPSWEIWGLAWRFYDHPRMDVGFEVHDPDTWQTAVGKPELFAAWLNKPETAEGAPVKVYLLPHVAALYPQATAYPVKQACELMGRRYFTSSFSYMLALAIMEGVDEIGIWGVDLVSDEEYSRQRPAAEYLLGIAHAKGIKLTIADQSALLKSEYVYGLENAPLQDPIETRYGLKAKGYRDKIDELKSEIFILEGAAREAEDVVEAMKARRRGLWAA